MYVSRSQQVAIRCALALPQVNRIILGKLLQSFGFDVSYSENGQEAVQRFLRCPDISCILMVRLAGPLELCGPLSCCQGSFHVVFAAYNTSCGLLVKIRISAVRLSVPGFRVAVSATSRLVLPAHSSELLMEAIKAAQPANALEE